VLQLLAVIESIVNEDPDANPSRVVDKLLYLHGPLPPEHNWLGRIELWNLVHKIKLPRLLSSCQAY
jgi:hypothetical protein